MTSDSESRNPIDELAERFIQQRRNGESVDIEYYAGRYPELASEIRELFPTLLAIENLKPNSKDKLENALTPLVANKKLPTIPGYLLIREIGRGGMGVVYEARRTELGRRVALKTLSPHLSENPDAVERFRHEARAAASLHHSNIVPVFDVGRTEQHVYYTMQFIVGDGLDKVTRMLSEIRSGSSSGSPLVRDVTVALTQMNLEDQTVNKLDDHAIETQEMARDDTDALPFESSIDIEPLSRKRRFFKNVARIGVQLAEALHFAHNQGVIHRDIKPSNILLDTVGNAWIADFGLAKTQATDLTHSGNILGTLKYMPPERMKGISDHQGDVYSLGATLYEVLLQKPPFEETDQLALIDQVRHQDPPTPRTIDPTIPFDLHTIVLTAMHKQPERRYRTAGELAADLQRFINGEPIKARRSGMVDQALKWIRRRPAIAALATLCLLITSIAAPIIVWQYESSRLVQAENRHLAEIKEVVGRQNYHDTFGDLVRQWNDGDPAGEWPSVRRMLNATEEKYRGWEWDHLYCRTHQFIEDYPHGLRIDDAGRRVLCQDVVENRVFVIDRDRSREVFSVKFDQVVNRPRISPDGTKVAVVQGNEIEIWDVDLSIQLIDSSRPNATSLNDWNFGPLTFFQPDGTYAAWHLDSDKVVAFDTSLIYDGRQIGSELFVYAGKIDDSATIHQIPVWDMNSGKQKGVLSGPHDQTRSAIGNRSAIVAMAWDTRKIEVWDFGGDDPLKRGEVDIQDLWGWLTFSPDDRLFASTDSESVRVWTTDSLEEIRIFEPSVESKGVDMPLISPDNRWIVGQETGPDGTIFVWDIRTGKITQQLEGNDSMMLGKFLPDNLLATYYSYGDRLRIWVMDPPPVVRTLNFHDAEVVDLDVDEKGRRLITAGGDNVAVVFDIETGDVLSELRHDTALVSARFIDETTAICRTETELIWWDIKSQMVIHKQTASGVYRENQYLRIDYGKVFVDKSRSEVIWGLPDSGGIVSIQRLDALTGSLKSGWVAHGSPETIVDLDLSPDATMLATCAASDAFDVSVWNLDNQHRVWHLDGHTGGSVYQVRFHPLENQLASAAHEPVVILWDLETGESIAELEHEHKTKVIAYHPLGNRIATGDIKGNIHIWDLRNHKRLLKLTGHQDEITALRFTPDGHRLVSTSMDKTVRIWNSQSNQHSYAKRKSSTD